MRLEKTELIKKDWFGYIAPLVFFIAIYSFLIYYQEYKNFIRFDSAIVNAIVLKSYDKRYKSKNYKILKLKTDNGVVFYTKLRKKIDNLSKKKLILEVYTNRVTFYEYLTSFYCYSKIIRVDKFDTLRQKLNLIIEAQHKDKNIVNIYQALFCAKPLNKELQKTFSYLGISHLFAISGFHLSVLSAFLFFIFKPIYVFFQNRYFPYRNINIDLFLIISFLLLWYLIFLDVPPSLLRSYFMLILGFILYDRGVEIISMQTLMLSVIVLLAVFIKLIFSLGFWLSVAGVFYIFLFFIIFKNLGKVYKFVFLPVWVYITMLPYTLVIFGNFSIYHPLSIVWTLVFSFFYPTSIALHLIGKGDFLDPFVDALVHLNIIHIDIILKNEWLYLYMVLSLFVAILFYNIEKKDKIYS